MQPTSAGWSAWIRGILQEPFVHFLILGALIFGAGEMWNALPKSGERIIIGSEQVRRIAEHYQKQYGNPPSTGQLNALVDAGIQEEIYYREGLALNLDRDDELIRRRIAQKYKFLQEDLDQPKAPTDFELQAYYQQHPARYAAPARVSFTHIYFSPDQGGEDEARSRAERVLRSLGTVTRAPERGDRFPDQYDYAALGSIEAARLFGTSALTDVLFNAPPKHWTGPVRSGYGWHLVYLYSRQTARALPLAEIRHRVLADYLEQQRQQKNVEAFARLKRKYIVIRGEADAAQH